MIKQERKTKQINIRVTPSLWKRFATALQSQGHTTTDALIMLITQYCEKSEESKHNKEVTP